MFHVKQLWNYIKSTPAHRLLFFLFVLTIPIQARFTLNPADAYIEDYFSYHLAIFVYLSDVCFILFTLTYFYAQKNSQLNLHLFFPLILAILSMFHVEQYDLWLYWCLKITQFWLIINYIYQTKVSIRHVFLLLVVGGLFQSFLAIIQFHVQHGLGLSILGEYLPAVTESGAATLNLESGKVLRAYGTFPHPNVLGGFLAICFAGLLYVSRETKSMLGWLYVSCGTFLILWGLLLTFSRTAWLAAAVSLSIAGIYHVYRRNIKIAAILAISAIVSCGTLGLFYKNVVFPRVSEAVQSDSQAISYREQFNQYGLEMFQDQPMFGVGPGQYTVFLQNSYELQPWEHQPAHNIFLFILAELGIIGLFLWFWPLIRSCFTWNNHSFGLVLFVPCTVILGFFDHYLITIQQGFLLFALIYGILLGQSSSFTERET